MYFCTAYVVLKRGLHRSSSPRQSLCCICSSIYSRILVCNSCRCCSINASSFRPYMLAVHMHSELSGNLYPHAHSLIPFDPHTRSLLYMISLPRVPSILKFLKSLSVFQPTPRPSSLGSFCRHIIILLQSSMQCTGMSLGKIKISDKIFQR